MQSLAAKPVIEKLRADLAERVKVFAQRSGRPPSLSVVLVGDNPASVIYTTQKGKIAAALGITHQTIKLQATASKDTVHGAVSQLNENPNVDGILIQRPLSRDFPESEIVYWVDPCKDVDAFHPENAGRLSLSLPSFIPCTPKGILYLLKFYGISPRGKLACIIGRSSIVGKPMAALLLQEDATLLHCHSKTSNLNQLTQQADILVCAIGKDRLIRAKDVKPGAVVIDVGINRDAEGKVHGDVDFESVSTVASAITPVPGGVGPMTIWMLMQNTIEAAEKRLLVKKD